MLKKDIRSKAMVLRKKGIGIKTIAKTLKRAPSTIRYWCKDVVLTPNQILELERRSHDPDHGRRKLYIENLKKEKRKNIELLRRKGIKEIGKLSRRDLFLVGIALYWAEGFKKDRRLGFANSDPKMILLFIRWLQECCDVPKTSIKVRVGLNISHKLRLETVETYWSNLTGITRTNFQKPYFQRFQWKKQYSKPEEYYGVLRIRASKQLPLFRKINGWIEGLKSNGKKR